MHGAEDGAGLDELRKPADEVTEGRAVLRSFVPTLQHDLVSRT